MARSRDFLGWPLVWLLFGIAVAFVVGTALYTFLGSLLFAVFLYYATRPLYRRLDEYIDHPDVTVTLTLLAVVLPLLAVVVYASFVALQELNQFLATHSIQGYRSFFQPYLALVREGHFQQLWDSLVTNPGQPLSPAARAAFQRAFGGLLTVAGLLFTVLTRLFLMSVFLFYLLRDDYKLRRWFYDSVNYDERVVSYTSNVDDDLETVFFGNLAIIVASAAIAVVTYYLLNFVAGGTVVGIPVLLGLLIGIGTMIPIVGMKIVYVPYGLFLVALAATTPTPLWHPVAFFVVTFFVVDTIPDFFVRSFLSARGNLHVGLILLGYVLGVMAFGWMGLFLGPLVVVVMVHFARSIFPWLVEEYGLG
ncbi:AI-2E family transporter [Halobacterium zhouii]|uniref:AI-2E family transporter n=1 Tax=Halobacterium zhouii TaxID=2902624 RepID=UPI001E48560E|nr:AI-2E family transporter [Halobacterium zhouii]